MNVRLVRFHYDFTMTGKVRDLFSISCRFQPILRDGASEEEAKACARELVEVYMDKLDRIYRELVKGTREPFMKDLPIYIRKAIELHLEDLEDLHAAEQASLEHRQSGEPALTLDELSRALDLDN